jgi:hypothetical protein
MLRPRVAAAGASLARRIPAELYVRAATYRLSYAARGANASDGKIMSDVRSSAGKQAR